jgi:hypothetical protein
VFRGRIAIHREQSARWRTGIKQADGRRKGFQADMPWWWWFDGSGTAADGDVKAEYCDIRHGQGGSPARLNGCAVMVRNQRYPM